MIDRAESQASPSSRVSLRPWLVAGFLVILLIFGGGGAWALFARIAGAIIAAGQISPESGVRTVQHPEGGIVKEIRVRDGAAVERGQVLILLDDKTLRTQRDVARNRLDNVLLDMARLEAESSGASELRFPEELMKRAAKEQRIREAMRIQKALFVSRRRALEGEKRVVEQQIAAQEKAIAGLRARLESINDQSELIEEEIRTVSHLLKKGQATRPRLMALQREAVRLVGRRGEVLEQIAKTGKEIARLSQKLTQLERNFLAQVLESLVKRKEEAANLSGELSILEQKLARVQIRAPVSGRVFNLAIRTIGGVIAPGKPILQIVPENEPLIIEAQIQPFDVDEVYPGQPARVRFSAFDARNTPELEGRVRMVSPAPVIGKEGEPPLYKVRIMVRPEQLAKLDEKYRLIPGMPVEVFITTGMRRPMDIFLAPILAGMRRSFRED